MALLLSAGTAMAQGGPPMVTDDPDTPGDGNWEINLGSIASRLRGGWQMEAFDADINYGLGERIQLKMDTPWNAVEQGSEWSTGLGTTIYGVKWRFYDDEESGLSISTYPQLSSNLDPNSARRGITNAGRSVLLPLEASWHRGSNTLVSEFGRSTAQQGPDEWIAGLIAAHSFSPRWECMLEVRGRFSPQGTETLLNLGSHWEFTEGLALLGAIGREFGAAGNDRVSPLVYLGLQLRL